MVKEYRVTITVDPAKVRSEGIYDPDDEDYSYEDTIKEELQIYLKRSSMGIVVEEVQYNDYGPEDGSIGDNQKEYKDVNWDDED